MVAPWDVPSLTPRVQAADATGGRATSGQARTAGIAGADPYSPPNHNNANECCERRSRGTCPTPNTLGAGGRRGRGLLDVAGGPALPGGGAGVGGCGDGV